MRPLNTLWKTTIAVVALCSLTACNFGGNQLGWEDAGDYNPKNHKVDENGVSTVAEDEIDVLYNKHIVPDYGKADSVDVSTSDLIDDFGDDYGLDRTTVTYYYDVITREDLKKIPSPNGDTSLAEECVRLFEIDQEFYDDVDDEICMVDFSFVGLNGPINATLMWTDPESDGLVSDGADPDEVADTRSYVWFEYDPRYE